MLIGVHAQRPLGLHEDSETVVPTDAILRTVHNSMHTVLPYRRDSEHARLCTHTHTLSCALVSELPEASLTPMALSRLSAKAGVKTKIEELGRRSGEELAESSEGKKIHIENKIKVE